MGHGTCRNRNHGISRFRGHVIRQVDQIFAAEPLACGAPRLTQQEIARARTDEGIPRTLTTASAICMGIDPGIHETHLIVAAQIPEGEAIMVHAERIPSPVTIAGKRVVALNEELRPDAICIDSIGIGANLHAEIKRTITKTRILAACFRTSEYDRRIPDDQTARIRGEILDLSKPRALRNVLRAIRNRQMLIPKTLPERDEVEWSLTSMSVAYQPKGKNRLFQLAPVYHDPADHYLCALVYAHTGLRINHK